MYVKIVDLVLCVCVLCHICTLILMSEMMVSAFPVEIQNLISTQGLGMIGHVALTPAESDYSQLPCSTIYSLVQAPPH